VTVFRAHIGCSGWNYASWKRTVYGGAPEAQWLSLYSQWFDTVEVNSTFYRLPSTKAVEAWVNSTPGGFRFAVKASRYLTHVKRLGTLDQGVARLYQPLEPLVESGKLGPVLWQLPATFHRNDERLASALAALPSGRHAFEFRHASWYAEDVYELLRDHDVALVIADHGHRALPFPPRTASWDYVRLHFGHRGRRGNYSSSEIHEWASRIRQSKRENWVYFNNDWEAFAPTNARELLRALQPHEAAA
jgi:uncharacterized protein YecE (DUF72 family)